MTVTTPVIVGILAFAFSATLMVDRRASFWTIAATVGSALLLGVALRLLDPVMQGWDLLLSGALTLIISGGGLAYEERRGHRVVAAILIALFGLYFVDQRFHFFIH